MNTTALKSLLIGLLVILFAGCNGKKDGAPTGDIFDETKFSTVEKLILEARDGYDFQRMITLADSLEKTGDISAVTANYYRGAAAVQRGMLKEGERYLKEATDNKEPDADDIRSYLKSRALLSRVLSTEGDHEGALTEALPTLAMMDSLGNKDYGDMTQLRIVIGQSQQNLHMTIEAAETFDKAYAQLREWMDTDRTGKYMPRIIIRLDNITTSYITTSDYKKAKMWLDREDSALAVYISKPDTVGKQVDLLRGTISLDLAEVCQQLGRIDEATRHYNDYLKTFISKRSVGRINATDYLMLAGRYAEAADNYACLDHLFEKRDYDLSLDNIGIYLLPKMKANVLAGRKDSAIAVGMKIVECFDSALTSQKEDAAAELATIYDTQGKERKIAEQEMRLSRTRVIALIVAIIALTIFFLIIDIYRRRAAKRLAKVNAAKERMESELSIARNIQMSMVPSTFPDVKGLDMYARMTPAKEVGGDLYGYLLEGNQLYFAIGDVSGKGVPASLFMAQATRLFLTLAKQGMKPAEICTRLNNALSGEDNENGMFVTMFVCRLNLKLNLLEYCNAGHNPPVLGNADGQFSFLEMEPNAPIGLWPGLEYEGESIDFFKDRLLLLYTDGLNEAENRQQEQFGEERIIEILTSQASQKCQDIIEILETDVNRFRNGTDPNDDLTMLCMKLI